MPRYPDPTVRPRPKKKNRRALAGLTVDALETAGTERWRGNRRPSRSRPVQRTAHLGRGAARRRPRRTRWRGTPATMCGRLRGAEQTSRIYSSRDGWDRAVMTSSMRTRHTPLSVRRFAETRPGETERVSRFYRPDWDGLCNTLRAGTGSERGAFTSPRPIHPRLPRVLSNREAARLHSFPDWFRLHATSGMAFARSGTLSRRW